MNRLVLLRTLPVLAALALAACADSTPTALVHQTLTPEDHIALQVLQSPDAMGAAMLLADVPGASGYAAAARQHFGAADRALRRGLPAEAAAEAREARLMVVQALSAAGGPGAAASMVERVEDMLLTVGADPAWAGETQLRQDMTRLVEGARARLRVNDAMGAGQLGVLAEQRARMGGLGRNGGMGNGATGNQGGMGMGGQGMGGNGGMGGMGGAGHTGDGLGLGLGLGTVWDAGLLVDLGATAVALADGILDEQGADAEQVRYLALADDYQTKAVAALDAGRDREGVYLAGLAQWTALKSVVLPGGITDEDARFILELAQTLYDQAEAAVGAEPTEQQAALLEAAEHMLEAAEHHAGTTLRMGVGGLWRSAVISAWLIG
ncbi:MAG: hypothetical protein Q8N53_14990 [Longimicrobiales bacterium]|nr:hypothetical protein [Longimicrobiales bacterium]